MKKVVCGECGRKREPYRPVHREAQGHVTFVCRQCWNQREYAVFMHEFDEIDRRAFREAMR